MNYLAILDYSTGTIHIEPDPAKNNKGDSEDDFDYDEYISNTFGKMDYHYMVGNSISLNV